VGEKGRGKKRAMSKGGMVVWGGGKVKGFSDVGPGGGTGGRGGIRGGDTVLFPLLNWDWRKMDRVRRSKGG